MTRFSKRHGYAETSPAEITVREDAPHELRGVVVDIAYECGLEPHPARAIVCNTLRVREDPNNWSAYPNVDSEVRWHLDRCEWYEVYDVIEAFYRGLEERRERRYDARPEQFGDELNEYFVRRGIGWQLVGDLIQVRGDEEFEGVVQEATEALEARGRDTAANEIHQALRDLSRRPRPDLTGAVQHALASLECVARDVTGDPRSSLGDLLKHNAGLVPKPMDEALTKLWGYASEQGRHLREGREPAFAEAELAVVVAAAVARYFNRKETGGGAGAV